MTERERLVELLKEVVAIQRSSLGPDDPSYEAVAAYLLVNGVTVLPLKVGDTIYRRGDPIKKIYEWEVEHIEIYADEIVFIDDSDNKFNISDIGKTVFLSREDAEKEE